MDAPGRTVAAREEVPGELGPGEGGHAALELQLPAGLAPHPRHRHRHHRPDCIDRSCSNTCHLGAVLTLYIQLHPAADHGRVAVARDAEVDPGLGALHPGQLQNRPIQPGHCTRYTIQSVKARFGEEQEQAFRAVLSCSGGVKCGRDNWRNAEITAVSAVCAEYCQLWAEIL